MEQMEVEIMSDAKIKAAFNYYDNAMASLHTAYEKYFNRLGVNKAGETSAEQLLKLNAWYAEEKEVVRRNFARMFEDS